MPTPPRDASHQHARPLVIAHRGTSLVAPENTLPAFELAIAAGAGMIETDALLTADGQVVLAHDDSLLRTTGRVGSIGSMTSRQLQSFDAGFTFQLPGQDGFTWRDRGVHIPRLDELLALIARQAAVRLNLELKTPSDEQGVDRARELADRAIRALRVRGMIDRALVSSFSPATLAAARDAEPRLATAMLIDAGVEIERALDDAAAAGHRAIHVADSLVGTSVNARRTIASAHERRLLVNVWTVNDPRRMRELTDAGIDGIITDDPATLRRIVDEAVLRS